MSRVVAGRFKGRRLRAPVGAGTRPTSDRVRESLFTSLTSMFGGLDGLRVLDLFAGSGALGIEALSRGAVWADLVDHDRKAVAAVTANVRELGLSSAKVHMMTARKFLRRPPARPYDLVFVDPPYSMDTAEVSALVAQLADPTWCRDTGVIVVERSTRDPFVWPEAVSGLRERAYGETTLWYGR